MNEFNEESIELTLETSEWVFNKADTLLRAYKECKTENCKAKIKNQLHLLLPRLDYELNQMNELIKKAKDEGLEF